MESGSYYITLPLIPPIKGGETTVGQPPVGNY